MSTMTTPEPTAVDVVVLGLGPGGEALAGELASAGLEVVGVEPHLVGGECPYYACIPTKMMLHGAQLLADARRANHEAGSTTVEPDLAKVAKRIREEATTDWDDTAAVERLEDQGVRVVKDTGRLLARDTVEVGGQRFRARRGIVLATGTRPTIPPIDGLDGIEAWTNREAVQVVDAPTSLLVVGGGPVAVELAQVFARFGTDVTLVQSGDQLVGKEEPEAAEAVEAALEADDVRVVLGQHVEAVRRDGDEVVATLEDGEEVRVAQVLLATGRTANTDDIGLEAADLTTEDGRLPTDERQRLADGLWAIGDITGLAPFTHVAVKQAGVAAADLLDREVTPVDRDALSWVTFTDPQVGRVGLTEQQARDAGMNVAVATASSSRAFTTGRDDLVKLVADRSGDGGGRLVGATAIGPEGGEVIGLLSLAVHARLPLDVLKGAVYAFPAYQRAVLSALQELG